MIAQPFNWGRQHSSQVCLLLLLAVFMQTKICHWPLHSKHFSSALLTSWTARLAALKGCLLPLQGLWAPWGLVPDACASPHFCGSFVHLPFSRSVFQNKIGWLSEMLAILAWNLSLVSIHTSPESCRKIIIEELRRSVWIQWYVVRRQAGLLQQRSLTSSNRTAV